MSPPLSDLVKQLESDSPRRVGSKSLSDPEDDAGGKVREVREVRQGTSRVLPEGPGDQSGVTRAGRSKGGGTST